MTAKLYLLRHAKTEQPSYTGRDYDRVLKPVGRADAKAAGDWLKSQTQGAPKIVSSTAARAEETAIIVAAALGLEENVIVWERRIYEASAGELLSIVNEHADAASLLMVGHNPGFEMLARTLGRDTASLTHGGMPTSGIAVIARDEDESWVPGAGSLVAFYEGHRRHR